MNFQQTRSQLLLVDVCNLLLCVSEILPSICENGESYVGLNLTGQSKIIRDVHAKCQELFCCLLLRGVSLGSLYKVRLNNKSDSHIEQRFHDLPHLSSKRMQNDDWFILINFKLQVKTNSFTQRKQFLFQDNAQGPVNSQSLQFRSRTSVSVDNIHSTQTVPT